MALIVGAYCKQIAAKRLSSHCTPKHDIQRVARPSRPALPLQPRRYSTRRLTVHPTNKSPPWWVTAVTVATVLTTITTTTTSGFAPPSLSGALSMRPSLAHRCFVPSHHFSFSPLRNIQMSSSSSSSSSSASSSSSSSSSSSFWNRRRRRSLLSSGASSIATGTEQTTKTNAAETPEVSTRIQETLDPCVVLMKRWVMKHRAKWEDKGGIYSLAQGVVYWKPPAGVYEALQKAVDPDSSSPIHSYSPERGIPSLMEALKQKVARENGLGGDSVDIMVTAGANQAYMNCILTLLDEGVGQCVVFEPYYFNHVMAIQMTRGNEAVLVGPPRLDTGEPDLQWLQQQLEEQQQRQAAAAASSTEETSDSEASSEEKRIQVVTLVNPGNPTGVSLSREFIQQLVNLCRTHGVWLIVDNTYEHFDHTGANSNSDSSGFWCSNEPHVVNIFSFSKGFGMAGFRVGYIVVSDNATTFSHMLKAQDTVPICVSSLSQVAALAALQAGRSWVLERVQTLEEGRRLIFDALKPLSPQIGGSGAMYVMARLPAGNDNDQEIAEFLVEHHGVAVIPGSFCGYPGWIRVCYSNLPPDQCQKAAHRLAQGIQEAVNRASRNKN